MNENESTVNAGVEEVVTPQETEQVESVESVSSEVATEQQEKPVQSKEENSKFAEVRRNAEREAQDKLIAEMYGQSHGIYTKADYDKAIREQKQQELLEQMKSDEVDPKEIYSKLKESDPDFQELQKIKTETYTQSQLNQLNAELKELDIDVTIKSLEDVVKLGNADDIIKHIEQGKTLSEAYFLANRKEIIRKEAEKVQQETIKKIQANGEASTGSLANNGTVTQLYTREQVDAMSQEEVNKNYDMVIKSMKTWK